MPRRLTKFISGDYYHLFNRSIYRQPILNSKGNLDMFSRLIFYYAQAEPPVKFSYYRKSANKYDLIYDRLLVTIISYCLMPNHFHLCVRQEIDGGIQTYMQRVLGSFSHYYRIKFDTKGPLFERTFRDVRVETDEQLIHLTRYHHLNPVTARIVEHPSEYAYSSYHIFMSEKSEVVDPTLVLSHFSSKKDYEQFVLDGKDYQRKLAEIKHLTFE